ncbi:MAG: phytoene desaturase [Phycisphaerae bacterium]|jgi:phytoene desaturase|nr:MAG: phytoene desaturase [Phycisphaerae bacterium]
MQEKRLLIVGAGVGGLAAAIRCRGMGHDVLVLEKNSRVGGKLNRRLIPHPKRPHERPFRFDTGPSLLTLPLVFADLFSFVGKDVRDYLSIIRLDPVSRFVWADKQTLELGNGREQLLNSVKQLSPRDVHGMKRFLDYGQHIWKLSGEFFLTRAPEQAFQGEGAFSPWNTIRALSIPFRIGMFKKYADLIDQLIRSPRLRQVLYQYATYSGSSPFLAPATLAVIAHVELDQGGWYIQGGLYRLAEAMEKVAREIGVQIQTDTTVTQILVDNSSGHPKVTGVRLSDDSTLSADAVIVNADVVYTYQHLIEPQYRRRFSDDRLKRLEPGGSGMVLCLGVEGTYPQLAHHTKFMPDDYTSDLRAMFETHTIPEDPCIYVCASTRTDPSQAPPNCENLFVLCSAPALDGRIDWTVEGPKYRDRIIHQLEHRFGLTDLSQRIVVEEHFTPIDLQRLYNAHAGSIYGISGNGIRQAFLRPPNRDREIQGLFFAGGATHPGGGLPLVALSGKIASELVHEYLKAQKPV